MVKFAFSTILLAAVLSSACVQRQLIKPVPTTVKLDIHQPSPLRAALYLSEKSIKTVYRSPDHIPWIARPNLETIRPFEIPVGRLFAETAFQVFSKVFKEVTIGDPLPPAGSFDIIVEPLFESIDLKMAYFTTGTRPPHNQLLDIGGSLEAKLRLTREGQPEWQKDYRVTIPADMILVNPWTGEHIARMLADGIASLVGQMAEEISAGMAPPATPLNQWLMNQPPHR